jgi:hypothetical protein
MSAHSSHLLQLLNMGYFSPLEKAYAQQIGDLMQDHVVHIMKDRFCPAFYTAYDPVVMESNIQGGFRRTGLIHFNPDLVTCYPSEITQVPVFTGIWSWSW